ncbi:MAG: TlpA family protein disulfide reductase [Gammaproteobacteria bacterium]
MLRSVLLLAGLLVSIQGATEKTPSILGFRLLNLDSAEVESLQQFKGKPTLMTFFQPDCNWCLRQFRVLNRLHQRCGTAINLLAVGVNGNRRELKQELLRLRPGFSAYQANAGLMESLGRMPATPFAIEANAAGHFTGWTQGYLPQQQLEAALTTLPEQCRTSPQE